MLIIHLHDADIVCTSIRRDYRGLLNERLCCFMGWLKAQPEVFNFACLPVCLLYSSVPSLNILVLQVEPRSYKHIVVPYYGWLSSSCSCFLSSFNLGFLYSSQNPRFFCSDDGWRAQNFRVK